MVARTETMASGAFSAISVASACAAEWRSSSGTSRSTMPSANASSPLMRRPVRNMRFAACKPTRFGNVTVRPKPG